MNETNKFPAASGRRNGKTKKRKLKSGDPYRLIKNRSHLFYQGCWDQKDLDSLQTGSFAMGKKTGSILMPRHRLNETHDKNQNQRPPHLVEYREEIVQWQKKSVMQRNAIQEDQHVLSTSLSVVATEIAKCIAGCLADAPLHKSSVTLLRQLLIDYKAVQSLHDGRTLISLHRVHLILQDNFSNSCLCRFCDIMLSESIKNTVSNSIDV